MSYCVFMHRADSIYDDRLDEQYQFPKQYLGRAAGSVGDWIVYLEPRRVTGTRGYFAVARVREIIPDPKASGMYLAIIEPGSYLEFAQPVSFNDTTGPIERGLLNEHGNLSGRAQAAVRPIDSEDFNRILTRGLDYDEQALPRTGSAEPGIGLEEARTPFIFEEARQRVEHLTSRILRDRVFRTIILRAYDRRCAITGLKFINGGGRAEVDAAHIQAVQHNGPDIVQNGIALSGTAHWMFDRGLISLSDDLEILISRQVNDIESIRTFINRSGRASLPLKASEKPHPRFLAWHRQHCFKQ
jgi:putative restriction endonuclease